MVDALPKDFDNGIYYGWASLRGQVHKIVASIGWNPYYKNKKKSMVRIIILKIFITHKSIKAILF